MHQAIRAIAACACGLIRTWGGEEGVPPPINPIEAHCVQLQVQVFSQSTEQDAFDISSALAINFETQRPSTSVISVTMPCGAPFACMKSPPPPNVSATKICRIREQVCGVDP